MNRSLAKSVALCGVLLLAYGCAGTPSTTTGSPVAESELRETDMDAMFATEFPVANKDEALARATQAWDSGDVDRALFFYVKALHFEPTDTDLLARIGTIHRLQGNPEMAVRAYSMALRQDPDHFASLQGRGLVLMAHERDDLALKDFEQALVVDPWAWRVHNGLGMIADRQGDHAKAISHYDAALSVQPGAPMLLNNRGYSRYLAGHYDLAIQDLLSAAAGHGYDKAWLNLARVYAETREYEEAISNYARVHSRSEALFLVAEAAARNGDVRKAEAFLRRAIESSPTYFPEAEESLAQLRTRVQ
jgi:Flp pilus assembly protein TadD